MLLAAAPAGAVGLDAHHGTDGVDEGHDASDRGTSLAVGDDVSGLIVGLFDQEDDGDDADGDEEGEGEEEADDDADEDEEAEAGDEDDEDEREDEVEDDDADDGGGGNPLATLVSELAGDSEDESDGDDGAGQDDPGDDASSGENSGDDSGARESNGDGSGGGNDEGARGDGERPPEDVGDVGEGSVDVPQVETPTSTPAPNATGGTPTPEGFRVESVSVNRSTVPSGEPVRITATVVNGWESTATRRVHLRLFDEVVDARNVTVPGESAREVSFVRRIAAPGTYEANVREAGTTFTVVAEETSSPAEVTGLPEVTGVQTPGFTALAAVLGVLGALLLAQSRRG
jgi:PGF-CTERM protein